MIYKRSAAFVRSVKYILLEGLNRFQPSNYCNASTWNTAYMKQRHLKERTIQVTSLPLEFVAQLKHNKLHNIRITILVIEIEYILYYFPIKCLSLMYDIIMHESFNTRLQFHSSTMFYPIITEKGLPQNLVQNKIEICYISQTV